MFRIIAMYAKANKFAYINPLEKITLCICCIIINGFSNNILVPLINLIVFIILHMLARNPVKYVMKLIIGIATFSLISSITFIFDYGISYSAILITKTLSSALCLLFLSFTTPLNHILYYINKVKFLEDICDIIKSTERFIISIEDESVIIFNAIRARGGFETKIDVVKNTGKLAGLLFVNTLRKWTEVKEAINSRCYNGHMAYIKGDYRFSNYRFAGILIYITMIFSILY
ncbi:cobalt ECF transporter T component CbiQ [Clostridium sp.]|uniref:cobalt ECF transporter T component CbiQ n=1 Tax=Clostridium sp. TaxID=1506 RepID=UPI002FCB5611